MFYKKDENGEWSYGFRIAIPNFEVLTSENRENDFGWIWHDNPPQEYLDWLEKQEIDEGD